MMEFLRIKGGTIYDPANEIDGATVDIWIADGRIIEAPSQEAIKAASLKTIDASGLVVMAGAIDMHCHIVGSKVNAGRLMQTEQNRDNTGGRSVTSRGAKLHSGTCGSVPSLHMTGYKYTGLGYTTCFDAAIPPLAARHVHHEFEHVPNVDTGFFTLVGNNHYAMQCAAKDDQEGLQSFLAWMLSKSGAYAPKIVNPGGVELWKQKRDGNARDLDQTVDGFNTTPRKIIQSITQAANAIGLPHPVHIHGNNLGVPGNWTTTSATMEALAGLKAHLTHIQFHSYGGGDEAESSLCSKVQPLAQIINDNPQLTVDVGQVMFEKTTSMTGDGPLGYYLQQLGAKKWFSSDTELESGCGVSPIEYKDTNFIHSMQWAIGLEWYLSVNDPWQVVMSTDHPNGGSFMAYPQIIRLLMDRSFRDEMLGRVNPKVLDACPLKDLTREYSLSDIAVITRAGPARILGLKNKGHLGAGADADVAIYTPNANFETMFSVPRYVIKSGVVVVEDHEIRDIVHGRTLSTRRDYDPSQRANIESWFADHYSLAPENYGIGEGEFERVCSG
jgi:formylmethanofuran dehydrogenase subunit A